MGDDDEGGLGQFDAREWEEEQTKLDRDWYMANEDGTLVIPSNLSHISLTIADG